MSSVRLEKKSLVIDFVVEDGPAALAEADLVTIADFLAVAYDGPFHLSEKRSVILPRRSRGDARYDGIKVKGSGVFGRGVDFGKVHDGDYHLPRYDFEGNYVIDAAKSFQRPWAGGMSYQQALQEYRVSRFLETRGFAVLPALGYGSIRSGDKLSWFCILGHPFEAPESWHESVKTPEATRSHARFLAESALAMADAGVFMALIGACPVEGRMIRKDFHSAHFADANDSFVTRLAYLLFDANFVLYTLAHPYHAPKFEGGVDIARTSYVAALTGLDCAVEEAAAFKALCLTFKEDATSTVAERVRRLAANPFGRKLLDRFSSESDRRPFL